jgi:hypothetical protein
MKRRLSVLSLALSLILSGLWTDPTPASSQQESATAKTVNVELVLDVSGSMAQVIDTGETRMDAAKRVIREVVAAIPEQEGINVGLRIYGFAGDNSEAGRPESCQSSELVAPIEGVNKEQILSQIEPLFPTGWTPLALSLERAGQDFQPDPNATNAVVLITDGLETCDGDPCATASALHAADIRLTTHVVGFGLNAEEQALLGCIAEGGGGMLLGASNASELSSALFDILQELEVVQGVGFVGGTALGILPEGEPGVLSVLATGTYDGNFLPLVVRNNTGQDIIRITATVTATNPAGQVIASGNDQLFNPNLVRSGGVAFGYAYFGGIPLPPDTTFETSLDYAPATEDEFENRRDFEIIEASTLEGRVVGTLQNVYDKELTGPISTSAVCFDEAGNLLSFLQSYSTKESAAPEESFSFQVDNFTSTACPLFLVAGSGWDNTFGPSNSVEPPGSPIATPPSTEAPISDPLTASPAADSAGSCADLTSAESILLALQQAGFPVGDYVAYTAADDPNGLLGRPGQYISKVNFVDTTLVPNAIVFDIGEGGSIEVFETQELAQARADYIFSVVQLLPSAVEYDFVVDGVLLRLSGALLPAVAEEYHIALQEIASCSPAASG